MKIVFRNFDEQYLDELIKIHKESFKHHFNSRLSKLYTSKFLKWFAKDRKFASIIFLAVDGETGELIGYMCGAQGGYVKSLNRTLLPFAIFSFITNPLLFLDQRLRELITPKINSLLGKIEYPQSAEFESEQPQPVFSVTAFALNQKLRRAGFGYFVLNKLFDFFFEEVRKRNGKTVRATIRSFNKDIYKYYSFQKWQKAPHITNSATIQFYKQV